MQRHASLSIMRYPLLLTIAWLVNLLAASSTWGEVVFDGTIGPNAAGTTLSGDFEVTQTDGSTAGSNLFHSFSAFNVNPGERATFSHIAPSIDNIIARVTGDTPTDIYGAVQTRFADGTPSNAALWLLNPNGILIGDGAQFDPQGSYYLSTANRLAFEDGASLYTHEIAVSSVLSIAAPVGFGFLDQQDLPSQVAPQGITVTLTDPSDTNTPLFLANTTLVGTSNDPSVAAVEVTGDIEGNVDPNALFAPADSSQLQALNFTAVGLNEAGFYALNATSPPTNTQDYAPIAFTNINLILSDAGLAPVSALTLVGSDVQITNSFIDTLPFLVPVSVGVRAFDTLSITNSALQTTTLAAVPAGELRLDASSLLLQGSTIGSRALGTVSGMTGNVVIGGSASLPMQSLDASASFIQSSNATPGSNGAVAIQANAINLTSTQLSNINTSTGAGGDIVVVGDGVLLDNTSFLAVGTNTLNPALVFVGGGSGGVTVQDGFFLGQPNGASLGADIQIRSTGDISFAANATGNTLTTTTRGDGLGGGVAIVAGGALDISGPVEISSGSLGAADSSGRSGAILLTGDTITLADNGFGLGGSISTPTTGAGGGADITLAATRRLTVLGDYLIGSVSTGLSDAGNVSLQAGDLDLQGATSRVFISSTALADGNSGAVTLTAGDSASLTQVDIGSVSTGDGAAGGIRISAANAELTDTLLTTATVAANPANPAAELRLTTSDSLALVDSALQSNSGGAAPAGEIRLTAGERIDVRNTSIQSGTLADGRAGNIVLTAGTDLTVSGAQTELLTNSLGSSAAGNISLSADRTLLFSSGAVIQTSAEGAADAGNIALTADHLNVFGGRIESVSVNAGGGNISFGGRNIAIDGAFSDSGIVFITADSQSSDSLGNGGSVFFGQPQAPADRVLIRQAGITASAAAGNGGQININGEALIRDARSILLVTSASGAPGSLEINAPEQDISASINTLEVEFFDEDDLLRSTCAPTTGNESSLVIRRTITDTPSDDYLLGPGLEPATDTPGFGSGCGGLR